MFPIRTMVAQDFDAVAELIYLSSIAWYEAKLVILIVPYCNDEKL